MSLINTGIEKGLIKFDEEKNFITYIHQGKKRSYNNPEEKVQAETFLTLVLNYGYPVNRIKQFVSVQMGSETKEADIIIYADDECEETYILVECKKEEITDQQFKIAVDQAYSYCVAEGGKYVWTTSKIINEYYEVPKEKPRSRISIPDIPQFGSDKLAPYKYVKGGFLQSEGDTENNVLKEPDPNVKQKFFELEIVSENELTKIFIQAHQALWGGGQRNPSVAFDELDKLIFCKIWDEKHPRKTGMPYDFQIFREETSEDLLERIKGLYEQGRKKDPEVFKDDITLTASETLTIVKYFQRINLNKTDLDSKGKAFETFMGSFFRGDFGQYFTPRPIVKFIVDSLPINNHSRVLDTSCGSGGFLLHALDKVREQANDYYDKIKEEKDHFRHWHDFAEKNLFGIEINDQIARTAKMNMIIHDDGHTNVIASDGLLSDTEMQNKSKNKEFVYGTFDFIITNPPFGSSIKQTEKAYMHQYNLAVKEVDWLTTSVASKSSLRESQSTEVLFLEQCHKFLTEHGYLAIVIPDGILTNSSLQYVRDSIEEMYRIVAVISMPQTAFSATGAGVKSSVLFVRKHKEKQTEKISNLKEKLKEKVKTDTKYIATIEKWEKEKAAAIKVLEEDAKKKNPKANKKEITEMIQADKSAVQSAFTDKVNLFKEELTEKYFLAKQTALDDYPIFMAIAEDIGYDATGRNTNKNELTEIGEELSKFIAHINKSEK
ncbi:MAG: N-6 DNA methylase [Bacteroidia bacterium]|nr:N-6 DNA methylase [Bacteroidia bacterium]MCF8428076.1 N-6 DNA methylase [Bacteroidia bacterium]MCF8448098.1 N-6 DNA methylase [Bacteroidia bacterium]